MEDRVAAWCEAINASELFDKEDGEKLNYQASHWEREKEDFPTLDDSSMATELDVYKFHQAATYHRYYTLKDLLPKHDIVIF